MADLFNDTFFTDPWKEMRRMQRDMDRLWTSFDQSPVLLTSGTTMDMVPQGTRTMDIWRPLIDVKSTNTEVLVHAELPGVKKEDINIELKDGVMTIYGKRLEKKKEDNEKYHRSERFFGSFSRSMAVPKELNEKDIRASYDNGVLEITFPNMMPQKRTEKKMITIQ